MTLRAVICALVVSAVAASVVGAKTADPVPVQPREVEYEELRASIESLKGKKPLRGDVSEYITNKLAAQQLGKALFWDIQVGSDGGACASCHFAAGADIRITNQVNPGLKAGDSTFNDRAAGGPSGPNKTFTADDFPFHRLANPKDRESEVKFDTNDVFSSQGTFSGNFVSNKKAPAPANGGRDFGRLAAIREKVERVRHDDAQPALTANENCANPYDPSTNPFHAGGSIYRKVEPRQTPTVINAVFNYRQFWDGRANNQFNGVDPFGPRTFQQKTDLNKPGNTNAASAGTLVFDPTAPDGSPRLMLKQLLIPNSSLASQAVGPALSNFEMSCGNKTFQNLGRKLLALRPLAKQKVHAQDSVLARTNGLISRGEDAKGLNTTYRALVRKAFNPKFWADGAKVSVTADGRVVADARGYTQMEQNFSLFWGLAVQEYMAMLVSDDSPFDRAMHGDTKAMSDRAKVGQMLFLNKGACAQCHFGPTFSAATFTQDTGPSPRVLEHMEMGDGSNVFYDGGFYNIGVRPTAEDLGVGATDPYGFDLSLARNLKWRQLGRPDLAPDRFDPTPCKWIIQFSPCKNVPTWSNPLASERDSVDGTFKVPDLRNVGLTPPYFHNGGESNLRDVLRFYSRGGNRRGPVGNDTSRSVTANSFGQINPSNLDPDIGVQLTPVPEQHNALLLTEAEIDDLVQFLLALTDERVACQSGVFDHPELPISFGQKVNAATLKTKDIVRVMPAVGRRGLKSIGKPCLPNSGDLFGSVNKDDPTPLQPTLEKILDHNYVIREAGLDKSSLPQWLVDLALTSTTAAVDAGTGAGTGGVQSGSPGQLPAQTTTATVTAALSATRAGTARPLRATAANPVVALATAALVPPPPVVPVPVFTTSTSDIHGFTAIGYIQDAILTPCPGLPQSQWGGTATLNGQVITIPCNSIVQLPAATFTWSDMFNADLLAKFGPTQTPPASLTLTPNPAPAKFAFPSTEIRIDGNIVKGQHIAGLVYVAQEALNTGTGYIAGFDYENGVILVGRSPGATPFVQLQLNDPKILDAGDPAFNTGRYSAGQTPDARFSADQQNPTFHAFTGYPMCVPRKDPTVDSSTEADPKCPQINRPLVVNGCRNFQQADFVLPTGRELAPPAPGTTYCSGFVMKAAPGTTIGLPPGTGTDYVANPGDPDVREQAPFEVGDLINWTGTLLKGDGHGPNGSDTISVNTIIADVGIFTQPGTLPSYIAIGDFRVGTSPPPLTFKGVVLGEIDRIILEAFTTDINSIADIYLVDKDPDPNGQGKESQRWITPGIMTGGAGAVASNGQLVDGGITTQFFGAQPSRVRLRATHPSPGILTSPTRYVRVALRSLCDPANINGFAPPVANPDAPSVDCLLRAQAANGLYSGQYLAPTFRFVFPENIVPGDPIVPYNFWDMGFLVNGEGPGTGGLSPTPW